jgi:hypothetical protein
MIYTVKQLEADFPWFNIKHDTIGLSIGVDAAYRTTLFISGSNFKTQFNNRIEKIISEIMFVTSQEIKPGEYLNIPEYNYGGGLIEYPIRFVLDQNKVVGIGHPERDFFILFEEKI